MSDRILLGSVNRGGMPSQCLLSTQSGHSRQSQFKRFLRPRRHPHRRAKCVLCSY